MTTKTLINESVADTTEKNELQESNRIELKRKLTEQASDQPDKSLLFCAIPSSIKEMMQNPGLSHRRYFRNTLLHPLIASGKLALPTNLPALSDVTLPSSRELLASLINEFRRQEKLFFQAAAC